MAGRSTRSLAITMVTVQRKVPIAALILPPIIVLGLHAAWFIGVGNPTNIITIAIWTVLLGVVTEGFALPIALIVLLRNAASRTTGSVVATVVGAASLGFGIIVMVTFARGM